MDELGSSTELGKLTAAATAREEESPTKRASASTTASAENNDVENSMLNGANKRLKRVSMTESSSQANTPKHDAALIALPTSKERMDFLLSQMLLTSHESLIVQQQSADSSSSITIMPESYKAFSTAVKDLIVGEVVQDIQSKQAGLCTVPSSSDTSDLNPPTGGSCACQYHNQQQTNFCVSTTNKIDPPTMSTPAATTEPSSQAPPQSKEKAAEQLLLKEVGYKTSGSHVVKKRQGYLSWDDYFMSVASLSSFRSKDPDQPSGCCLVDHRNRIVGIGYNGFPAHCSDDCLPWKAASSNDDDVDEEETKQWLHSKAPYLVHAEVNAILNKCSADIAERGARLYVLDFPCNECAKVIIQAGLSEVIYLRNDDPDSPSSRASRLMLLQAGVALRCHEPERTSIDLELGQFLDPVDEKKKNDIHSDSVSTKGEQEGSPPPPPPTPTIQQRQYRDLMLQEAKGYDPCTTSSGKRTDYISWDDYFMAVAFLTAQRSKDPSTQVGACIVMNKRIVGLGYNGFPAGCSDDHLPWARRSESNELHTKYPYVCHAEVNAILNKCTIDVKGATLYVALFPCNECTKMIIQAGIRELVYMSDKYHDTDGCRASRIMLKMAGVKTRQHIPTRLSLSIPLVGGGGSKK